MSVYEVKGIILEYNSNFFVDIIFINTIFHKDESRTFKEISSLISIQAFEIS